MMTNALNIFFNHNPMGLFNTLVNTRTIKCFNKYFIPICPNLLGGILLFSERLEENAEKLLVIKDSGLFTLPEIDDIHTRLSEGEANTILLEQLEME